MLCTTAKPFFYPNNIIQLQSYVDCIKEYDIKNTPTWVDRIQPISFIKDQLNDWGEYVKGYWNFSNENKLLNASGLLYRAPTNPYWEYSAGIGNIFKVFRIDFSWRGSYRDVPNANNFAIKGAFGFHF